MEEAESPDWRARHVKPSNDYTPEDSIMTDGFADECRKVYHGVV